MPCCSVRGKTLRRCGPALIPGPRACETMRCDNRPETRMPRLGPTHETRPRPLSFRPGGPSVPYDRGRDLPRLLPMWPGELDNMTPEKHHRLLQRLRRALREERRRGIAGNWTYDLARHARLYRALHAEIALMAPPLSTWVASTHVTHAADVARVADTPPISLSTPRQPPVNPAACRAPSSSPAASAPQHSLVPPWGNRGAAATSPGTPRATFCNECAGDASTI